MPGMVMQVPDCAVPDLALMPLQGGLHSSLVAWPDEEASQEQRLHDTLQLHPEVGMIMQLPVHLSDCCSSHECHDLCWLPGSTWSRAGSTILRQITGHTHIPECRDQPSRSLPGSMGSLCAMAYPAEASREDGRLI